MSKERYARLMKQLERHPLDWTKSGIGLETMKAALRCAPSELLAGTRDTMLHELVIREIFRKHSLDASWIHSTEGCFMLSEARRLAPFTFKRIIDIRLHELGLLSESELIDEGLATIEEIAEAMGEKVKYMIEGLSVWRLGDMPTSRPYMNEDSYRDKIIEALTAIQAGDTKEAERCLVTALEDVETVLAGGEL